MLGLNETHSQVEILAETVFSRVDVKNPPIKELHYVVGIILTATARSVRSGESLRLG